MAQPVLARGASFVAFVVALILAQSAIFIYWMERPGRGNPRLEQLRLAMAIDADVSRALVQDPALATDMVFADGSALELATVTDSPSGGYTAMLTVAV